MRNRFSLFIASILIAVPLLGAAQFAFASGYSYQRTFSPCQSSKCAANQTNFSVLVCANSTPAVGSCATVTGLNQTGGGAHVQNSNGYDIVFSSTACASPTLLNWEMEKYVASTGEMLAWVKFATLHAAPDTIYMCYGNSAISSFQGGVTGTAWNSNYLGVYHLADGTTLSGSDSTSNGYNLTVNGSWGAATGQIDGGTAKSNATTQYLTNASMPSPNSITVSFWQKVLTGDAQTDTVFNFGNVGSPNRLLSHAPYVDDTLYWDYFDNSTGRVSTSYATFYNAWSKVDLVYDNSTGSHVIYINGVQKTSSTASESNPTLTGLFINRLDTAFGKRQVDEFRVSNTGLSANWVATEYNNQSAPSTFETFGAETAVGGGAVNLFFFMWI